MDGRASQEVPVLSGVPQGTVLRPLMFLTYINDINRDISGTIKLFADGALLFLQIRSYAGCVSLQKDLDTLYSWFRRWRMQFKASKCHVLQVTKKKSIITHEYSLEHEKLSVVPSHPYLAIAIDMVRRYFTKGTTTQIRNSQDWSVPHWSMDAMYGTPTRRVEYSY